MRFAFTLSQIYVKLNSRRYSMKYNVWLDPQIKEVLAVPEIEATRELKKQLEKENVKTFSVEATGHKEAVALFLEILENQRQLIDQSPSGPLGQASQGIAEIFGTEVRQQNQEHTKKFLH